jgi:isoquinoline 1-oxidoreductase beta subunit
VELTRRRLLVGAALGGGLVVAWALRAPHWPVPMALAPGETGFDAWIKVARDGVVTVNVPQLEMGQGIATLLAQIVAVELGADWRQVAVSFAPVSEVFANGPLAARWAELWMPMAPDGGIAPDGWAAQRWAQRHRFMATADGMSIPAYEGPARLAAAGARALLAKAAAGRWDVPFEQCEVSGGLVRHGAQTLTFGELAAEAAKLTPPDPPMLRPAPHQENPQAHPPGSAPPFPRLDAPAKVDGGWNFAGDVRLPDMVYAAIRHAPLGEAAHLAGHDPHAARGIDGFIRLVEGPDWLAGVANNGWAAERALAAVAPRFAVQRPLTAERIEGALDTALKAAMQDGGQSIARFGDPDGLLGTKPPYSQRYDIAPAIAAPLETSSVVARLRGGLCEIWVATQGPEATRRTVADALGVAVEQVVLYPMAAGGSFDARLECPHAAEAALIAQAMGKPVSLTYTRWQEGVTSIHRPPVAAQVEARVDEAGGVAAWRVRAAMPSAAREFGARMVDGLSRIEAAALHQTHSDPLAMEGFVPPYAIPAVSIEQAPVSIGLPTGRLRGNGHGLAAFITESFIDEIANALKREPLSYRMAMLENDPRLAACLQRVSALSNWNGGHDASGQGIACHRIGGGCIAAVVTARRGAAGMAVDRIVAVADLGRIINTDIARQQIEGGLIYGMALALGSSPVWNGGLPDTTRLAAMNLPLLANCPEVEVDLMLSSGDPADPGELGVAVAAPAIANALFSASGVRFRRLPLGSEE